MATRTAGICVETLANVHFLKDETILEAVYPVYLVKNKLIAEFTRETSIYEDLVLQKDSDKTCQRPSKTSMAKHKHILDASSIYKT